MRANDIRTLYTYHYWATARILDALARITPEQFAAPAPVPWGTLRGTLVHLLWSERNWLARWAGQPTIERFREEEFPTIAAVVAGLQESERLVCAFLDRLDDGELDHDFHYTRFTGERRVQPYWQLLVHIVNHGTQHLSEAAILLILYGASPGDLDLSLSPLGRRDE